MFSFTEFVAFIFFVLLYCLSFICAIFLSFTLFYFYTFYLLLLVYTSFELHCFLRSARPGSGLWSTSGPDGPQKGSMGGAESSAPRCGSSCVQRGRLSLRLWTVAPPRVAPFRWLLVRSGLCSQPCLCRDMCVSMHE